ncbi:PfkB family carbohydrate kinase [Nocardia sp. NPDC001965]
MPEALFVGLSTLDIAYAVDRYPGEDTKTQASDQFLGAGGPAANAAVACAIVSGQPTTLITALGRHPIADLVRHDLTDRNLTLVDTTSESTDKPPVSSIVVAVEAGSRTIVGLDAARIQAPYSPSLDRYVDEATIVLIDGHHPELAIGVARRAAEIGTPVVLDAGRWKRSTTNSCPDRYRDLLRGLNATRLRRWHRSVSRSFLFGWAQTRRGDVGPAPDRVRRGRPAGHHRRHTGH